MMQKLIVKLDVHDNDDKRKVMKTTASISGLNSLELDLKEQKLTVTGDFDPVELVTKLRKQSWRTDMVSVGPAKKDEAAGDKKEDGKGAPDPPKYSYYPLFQPYTYYSLQPETFYCAPVDENPNPCVIC